MKKKVGITSIGYYFPRYYVSLSELLTTRGIDPNKATKGLGVKRMAIPSSNEDSITMGANAVNNLKCDLKNIGRLVFATECGIDNAKDNASYIHELCNLPPDCEAYDVKAACAAGTYGLWQIIDWIQSGRSNGRSGIVVCSDVAKYKHKSNEEITGGGGALALLVTAEPEIIYFSLETGSYKQNTRDFWKPLVNDYAIVDGKESINSYLNALSFSFQDYLNNGGLQDFNYFIFHTPYGKMACKAFNKLSETLHNIKDHFKKMTAPSLVAPSLVGNIYNGSLYLALLSLLELEDTKARDKSIGNFSFGSGCSSKFFKGYVNSTFNNGFGLFNYLKKMKKLSIDEYDAIQTNTLNLEETRGTLLKGVDKEGYHHYYNA
jgi:hydroxymethylglutaryl-CoA synthase